MRIRETIRLNEDFSLIIYDCLIPSIEGGKKVLYMLKKRTDKDKFSYYIFAGLKDLLVYILEPSEKKIEFEYRDRVEDEPKFIHVERLNLNDTSFIHSLAKHFY